MYVTGRSTWWLAARIHGHDVITHLIERDDDLIAHYVSVADRFLADLDAGTVPRTSWRPVDVAAIDATFRGDPSADAVHADAATLALVNRRRSLDDEITMLTAERDAVTARIKSRMGDAPALVDEDGEPLAIWRPHLRKGVNLKRLREDHPELVAEYTQESAARPFLLK
jgi:predicted phage-related endonuclease